MTDEISDLIHAHESEIWESPIEGLSDEELERRESRRHRELKRQRDSLLDLCLKAEALLDSIICGSVERSEVEALYADLKAKTDELVK